MLPKSKKPFEGELTIDEDKCTTCGACVDICPCDVLSFPQPAEAGQMVDKVFKDEKYCIYCGACENVCPVEAIEVKRTAVDHTPTKSKSWESKMDSLKT